VNGFFNRCRGASVHDDACNGRPELRRHALQKHLAEYYRPHLGQRELYAGLLLMVWISQA